MKMQVDTTNKIIEINESVLMGELISELKKMFPKTWQDFQIKVEAINVTSYIPYPVYPNPVYPDYPIITYMDDNTSISLT